jgi:hypothetical protein
MTEEKGTLLYSESNRNEKAYGFILVGLTYASMGFLFGYMAIMSSAVLLGILMWLGGFAGVIILIWARRMTPAQVFSEGIIFPSLPMRDIFHKDIFIPYCNIKTITWVKKGTKGYVKVLFDNDKIRLELTIRDIEKFIIACTPFVKVSIEAKTDDDKEKHLVT